MSSSTPTSSTGHRVPRGALVRLALVGTTLIFVSCASLLIWRSVTVEIPDSMFQMIGNPAWQGAEASVDGITLVNPHTAPFDVSSKYLISFHLIPGNYSYSVKRGQNLLYRGDVKLTKRDNIVVLHLPDSPDLVAPPTTKPVLPMWPFAMDERLGR